MPENRDEAERKREREGSCEEELRRNKRSSVGRAILTSQFRARGTRTGRVGVDPAEACASGCSGPTFLPVAGRQASPRDSFTRIKRLGFAVPDTALRRQIRLVSGSSAPILKLRVQCTRWCIIRVISSKRLLFLELILKKCIILKKSQ
jgi:hypothetical protein